MKNRIQCILFLLFLIRSNIHAAIPERKGWWKSDTSSNLTKAENGYGESLVLTGTQTFISGPAAGNGAVSVGTGSYFYHEPSDFSKWWWNKSQ
ncbi:MAG: hypothetical protein D4R64_02060 [Porphyromonadaceae bacterium]|nr:MAG: hypothetical protein D4R64_02060 [Porphyromonadaceae bacterium]